MTNPKNNLFYRVAYSSIHKVADPKIKIFLACFFKYLVKLSSVQRQQN